MSNFVRNLAHIYPVFFLTKIEIVDNIANMVIHISDFYQMFQSLKQFLEDYVPKKRHAKFQAGWYSWDGAAGR
jgi:hypothetical protein